MTIDQQKKLVRRLLAESLRNLLEARRWNAPMVPYHAGCLNTHVLYALMLGAVTPKQAEILENMRYAPLKAWRSAC